MNYLLDVFCYRDWCEHSSGVFSMADDSQEQKAVLSLYIGSSDPLMMILMRAYLRSFIDSCEKTKGAFLRRQSIVSSMKTPQS